VTRRGHQLLGLEPVFFALICSPVFVGAFLAAAVRSGRPMFSVDSWEWWRGI
jgi:hypothetical protein